MKIKELKTGEFVKDLDVYVKDNSGLNYKDKKTGKDKSVLKYIFADDTGEIGFVDWDKKPEEAKLNKNQVIKISGQISEYQDKKQISALNVATSIKKLSDFSKISKFDIEEMWSRYVNLISEINDKTIKYIAEELLLHEKLIKNAPAARGVHADWIGGLMEHSLTMYDMGKFICDIYKDRYFPDLNKDLILFGCLFHDLGKIWEYDFSNPNFESTYDGQLLSHIVMLCAEIGRIADKGRRDVGSSNIEEKTISQILHLIASHHGQLDWGSPIVPKTMEAVLLHQIDMIDARMMAPYNIMEKGTGEFTEKLWTAGVPFLRQKIR